MTITFYQLPGSAPCRSVALTAAALGVEMNFKEVALMSGEHMKPEFIKMNPQHTIPTIDDNGFYLWESRAIMTYLAEQYGKNDSLYPKDPKKRAIVNQRLYFDACTLYKAFADYYYPIIFAKGPKDEAKYESLGTALSFLDKFLEGQDYVAGKNMTLADLAIVASISTIEGEQILFDERNGRVAIKCGCSEEKNGKIVDNGNMNNRAEGGGRGCLSDGKMTIGDRKEMLREIVSRGGGLTAIPCTATFIRYVICLQQVMDYDLGKYKNVTRWYAKIKSEAPKYEQCNGAGAKAFKALVDELKKK